MSLQELFKKVKFETMISLNNENISKVNSREINLFIIFRKANNNTPNQIRANPFKLRPPVNR